MSSRPFLENDRTKQGIGQSTDFCAMSNSTHLQKFRAFLLEQDKSMDILAYLLCYFLEIKDKPGKDLWQ